MLDFPVNEVTLFVARHTKPVVNPILRESAMSTSPSSAAYGQWTEPSYEIKVRGTMHLWGSAGITKDILFDKQLVLHIHNNLFGEIITFGTQNASGTQESMGTGRAARKMIQSPLEK
jgi:hypothetical protein